MRVPQRQSSTPLHRRIGGVVWRLRHDQWLRPSMLSSRWLDHASCDAITTIIGANPLVLIDLGARGGIHHLRELRSLTDVYGFEPNEDQCQPLNSHWHASGYRNASFLPVAVAQTDGSAELFITASAGAISLLEPDVEFAGQFGKWFADRLVPVAREVVATTSLDTFVTKQAISHIDLELESE